MVSEAKLAISDQTRDALERCELFQDLDSDQLMEVAALVEEHLIEPDELLLREGEAANHLFVIVEGRALAQLEMYRGWLSLGLVGPSEAAGWSSLAGGRVYPASFKALTPLRVARIRSSGLGQLMDLNPALGYPISRRLSWVFGRQYQAALELFRTNG